MLGKATSVVNFLRKPIIRKLVNSLPEDKLIAGLGSAVASFTNNPAPVLKALNLMQSVRPQGGFKEWLTNDEVLDAVLELVSELGGSRVVKEGARAETNAPHLVDYREITFSEI